MGQYYLMVNTTKKEYLSPRDFQDGAKFIDFSQSLDGSMMALAILLASSGEGDFDIETESPYVGRWAGDKIVIAGDYAHSGKHIPNKEKMKRSKNYIGNLYNYAERNYIDISQDFIKSLQQGTDLFKHIPRQE